MLLCRYIFPLDHTVHWYWNSKYKEIYFNRIAKKSLFYAQNFKIIFWQKKYLIVFNCPALIQRYRVRERNGKLEKLYPGVDVYGGYTPLHTNLKEINGTTTIIKSQHSSWRFFLPSWIQILLLTALNILLNNMPG